MGPQLGRSKCGLQAILEAREMVFQQHFLYFHFQSRRIFALIGYYVHTSLLIILSNVSSLTSLTKAKHVMFFCASSSQFSMKGQEVLFFVSLFFLIIICFDGLMNGRIIMRLSDRPFTPNFQWKKKK